MTDMLQDPQENVEIATAQRAVAVAEHRLVQLRIAALARITRLAFPDAAGLVVDATDACGHNDSNNVTLVKIYDVQMRPLWTTRSEPPNLDRAGVAYAVLLDVLRRHLTEAFDANDPAEFGWDELPHTGRDKYALQLSPAPSDANLH